MFASLKRSRGGSRLVLGALLLAGACAAEANEPLPASVTAPSLGTQESPPDEVIHPANPFSSAPVLEPLTGYGDFSDYDYWDIDWYYVTELEVECMNDNGFAVTLMPTRDGISYASLHAEQLLAAQAVFEACQEGLNLPDYVEPSVEQMTNQYYFFLEVMDCLEREGFAVADPPSLDTFIDTWFDSDAWHPYGLVARDESLSFDEWNALNLKCPQH